MSTETEGRTRAGGEYDEHERTAWHSPCSYAQVFHEVEEISASGENWHGKWQKPGLTPSRAPEQVATAQGVIPTDKRGSLSLKHKATAARIHRAAGQLCTAADRAARPGPAAHGGCALSGA